ncbi:LysM peptidoglycan-binding domain-containing protein [Clostridium novyi]|uniref:LysM domain protein n=3 Tax=Clostridium TaxID=1485 RepID=A0PY75_CLONN|nr:LysM domain-containing protein [Clostridium novyi]ABK60950.1 LysM domain protein [Clostridium novyi NT]KEH87867.1 peptidoglycan-binding protein LysM [Clostridium novyi A str. NCTC 538]KEH90094.1 peptidoglycan-binding protein LysM [Clostridium novyi A str. 4540]KEH95704.1 peptidoglycan-binding protein LysM [Clostridium novyi A str. GD211209]
MKPEIKKALIIISSSVVLFVSVFFLTFKLNNLSPNETKNNSVSLNKNSSDKVESDDIKESNNLKDNDTNTIDISNEKHTEYIVKEGDTLFSIARKTMPWKSQEDAVKTLQVMNSLKNRELLTVGSHLVIPVNTIDVSGCTKYIVQQGENLYTIAEKRMPSLNPNDAVKIIMQKNNLSDPSVLSTGLEIYIPNESAEANSNSVKNDATK